MKQSFTISSKLKKYNDINGYTFNSWDKWSAKAHIKYKLKGKFSEYEIDKAFRSGKIRLT